MCGACAERVRSKEIEMGFVNGLSEAERVCEAERVRSGEQRDRDGL